MVIINPRFRPKITLPYFRQFTGQFPDRSMPHLWKGDGEAPYIAALARQVGGLVEVRVPLGRADVMTDSMVFEVEHIDTWRQGARQALAYAGATGLPPGLALFGNNKSARWVERGTNFAMIYQEIRNHACGLTLWVWRPWKEWERITSSRRASLTPRDLAKLVAEGLGTGAGGSRPRRRPRPRSTAANGEGEGWR